MEPVKIIGIERAIPKESRLKKLFNNTAFAAAFGSFVAFSGAQVVEHVRSIFEGGAIMAREEIAEARDLMNLMPEPTTSAEASAVVKKLEKQTRIYLTEDAKEYIRSFIPLYMKTEKDLLAVETNVSRLKKEADAAAETAKAVEEAKRQQAQAEAAKAAELAAVAERQKQAEIRARLDEARQMRLNNWLRF